MKLIWINNNQFWIIWEKGIKSQQNCWHILKKNKQNKTKTKTCNQKGLELNSLYNIICDMIKGNELDVGNIDFEL